MSQGDKVSVEGWNVRARAWLLCFAAAFVLYGLTASRGPQWQDFGWSLMRMMEGEVVSPLGLALSHPLHHWLGRMAIALGGGLIEPCLAATLVSGLGGAAAVANVFGCVSYLTGSRRAGGFAAGSLAVAHTFWQLATLTESYTLGAALFSAEVWSIAAFLRRRSPGYAGLAFLFNGLGISNHMLAGLSTPVLVGVLAWGLLRRITGWKAAISAAAAWLAGAGPYLVLIAMEAAAHPGGLQEALQSALFGLRYKEAVLSTSISLVEILRMGIYMVFCFPNLGLPLAAGGVVSARRSTGVEGLRVALAAMLPMHLFFTVRYTVPDQHTFLSPAYVVIAVLAGIGFADLARTRSRLGGVLRAAAVFLLLLTPVVYALAPGIARRYEVLKLFEHHRPYRDDYVYLFTPWSVVERSADRMGRHAVELAGGDGVIIVEERTAVFAVRYWVKQSGTSAHVVRSVEDDAVTAALREGRRIVLVPADRNEPRTPPPTGAWRREGDLYALQR